MRLNQLIIVCLLGVLTACRPSAPFAVQWEFVDCDVEKEYTTVRISLTNTSRQTISGGTMDASGQFSPDWCILYSFAMLNPEPQDSVQMEEVLMQGTLRRLVPTALFQPMAPGEERSFVFYYNKRLIHRLCAMPEMFCYLPLQGRKTARPVTLPFSCMPFPEDNLAAWQVTKNSATKDSIPYASGENIYAYYQTIGDTITEGLHLLPLPKSIEYTEGGCDINNAIVVECQDMSLPPEGYRLQLDGATIQIVYADEAGRFYAQKTLQQIKDTHLGDVPNAIISDAPDYSYRGFLLDISRNFIPKQAILSIIETMSDMKLNRLQLHLTDDEAWRIEIPSYPELTKIGAVRRYSGTKANPFAETDAIYPQFADNWDNHGAPGSGYLSRKDYIEILRYAKQRHILVIPEIDMPGHMHAAKVAMYPRLSDSVMDSRQYMSPQKFSDCVMNVNSPFALEFAEHVVMDIVAMYEEAGCELPVFNIGGDEVPKGALTAEEHITFVDSVVSMLARHNMRPAGWEEMAGFCPSSTGMICYVWHHKPELLGQLVDSGYTIVISRNDRLYVNFAYANHEEEWGYGAARNISNEFRIFDWQPEDDLSVDKHDALNKQVIGTQAALWGESLRSVPQMETYIYPKLLAFAERAWNPRSRMTKAQLSETLYSYIMPAYVRANHPVHVPMPGIHVENNMVRLSTPAHGVEIRYTLDGGEPTAEATLYTEPFALTDSAKISAKAFYMGYESCTSKIY